MINLFKKITSGFAAVAIVLSMSVVNVQAGTANYSDVSSDAWFAPYVNALAEAGVFDSSKSAFNPAATMNRAEFVKTLVAAAGLELNAADAGFADVSASAWFTPYVNAAVAAGFLDGPMADKGNKFFPMNNISRAAATKIALGAFGIDAADYATPAAPFTDLSGHWGAETVTATFNLSIVDGKTATVFAPNADITRAAVAKIAAYTIIVADDAATYTRFEDGTSAFSTFTAENIVSQVKNLVVAEPTTTEPEVTEPETTEPEVTVPMSDGSLEISLASDSPKGAVIPKSVSGVNTTKFDVTSNGDDVTLTSLIVRRSGLGSDASVSNIAIYSDNGRVTKAKTFNSSSDEATLTFLNGGLLVEAGETVSLSVLATIGATNGERFSMEIVSASGVTSNATEVVGDFPITGATFEISNVTGATATISTDGTPSAPKLGTEGVDLAKFKIKNDSSDESIEFSSITLKENAGIDEEEELENFELYADGDKIASVSKMDSKYLTFNLDSAYTIASSKTIKFVVRADVIGGASKTVEFFLDNKLDLQAKGMKYGYGIALTNSLADANTTAITVEAGELTVVAIEPENTEIRKDKDDLIAGKIKIVSNTGSDIELQQVKVSLALDYDATRNGGDCDDDAGAAKIDSAIDFSDLIENVELYDESTGTTYDLSTTVVVDNAGGEDTATYADSDITIALAGTKTFAFRFDTKNASAVACSTITASLTSIGSTGGGLYVIETLDDKVVSDITPSSISFKEIEGKAATAVVTLLPLSSAKNAVIGSSDIVALDFEVKADDASALVIDEIKATGTTVDANTANASVVADNTRITEMKLWKKEGTNETLIDTVSASQLAAGVATFDGFNITVAKSESVRFVITTSIIDDQVQAGDTLRLALTSISVEDEDSDDVTATGVGVNSDRTITITGVGTLTATVDNTDNETNKIKNVLGNTTSDFVASFELTAVNEAVKIKDLYIRESGAGALKDAIESVSIYAADKTTLLATETVSADDVLFEDINHVVAEGSENIFVKVKTRRMGLNQSGKSVSALELKLEVTDADGDASGKTVSNPALSAVSNVFNVYPVQITGIEFVSSFGGESVVSKLTNGENNVAILKITAGASDNLDDSNGSSIKTLLSTLKFTVSSDAEGVTNGGTALTDTTNAADITIERIGGTGDKSANLTSLTAGAAIVNLGDFASVNAEIDNGTSAYYVIKATVGALSDTTQKYVQITIDGLDSGDVVYTSDTTSGVNVMSATALNIPNKTNVDAVKVSQ